MANIKIGSILRAGAYSPNHIGSDAAIINLAAEQLRKRGIIVNTYSEEQFNAGAVEEQVIMNMCRQPKSIERLQHLEGNGRLIINSGYGIENCIRERLTRILIGSSLPFPQSIIVDTNQRVKERLEKEGFTRCWVKRADAHAQHKEDISFARHVDEAQELLQEYFMRGIPRAVISKHVEGKMIKFYGVAGTNFFHWFYPSVSTNAKPSKELHGDIEKRLKAICQHAADEVGVVVYGGECVQGDDDSLTIIDFKDWPSMAPCSAPAATAIARRMIDDIKEFRKNIEQ